MIVITEPPRMLYYSVGMQIQVNLNFANMSVYRQNFSFQVTLGQGWVSSLLCAKVHGLGVSWGGI